MLVQDLMTKAPRTCRGADTLAAAAKLLWDADCGAVPVIDDGGKPIGMLTDRDCCMAAYTRGVRLQDMSVASAMAKVVFSVRADQTVGEAVTVMQHKQVRRLPVVDAAGRLCGVLSQADLLLRRTPDVPSTSALLQLLAATCSPRRAEGGASRRDAAATIVVPKAPTGVPTPVPPPMAAAAETTGKDKARGKKR